MDDLFNRGHHRHHHHFQQLTKEKEDLIPLQDHDQLSQIRDNPDDNDDDDVTASQLCTNPQKADAPPQNPDPDSRKDPGNENVQSPQDVPPVDVPAGEHLSHQLQDYFEDATTTAKSKSEHDRGSQGLQNSATAAEFEDAWNGDLGVLHHWQDHPFFLAESRVGDAQSSQPLRAQQQLQPHTTEGHLPELSQPSRHYHPCQNASATSSYVKMTSSPRNTAVVDRDKDYEGPDRNLVIVNTIAAFFSIFCCLCTGVAAFVVALQVHSKRNEGHYEEARQSLWCSFALVLASIFVFIPTLIYFILWHHTGI